MDLSETSGVVLNRHPWELSRTKCVLDVFSGYISRLKKDASYLNVGAGDLYFDGDLLKRYPENKVCAIDIAYKDLNSEDSRISKYHYLEEVKTDVDYAMMMDSLEYMEDDVDYVRKITAKVKSGGYVFFTLPAFPFLFSDYDINIRNLRRYNRKTFDQVLSQVSELTKLEDYYFYTSLFMVRFVQKVLHLPIDPQHKFTANWSHSEKGFLSKFLIGCLNLDFAVNRLLSNVGIRLPGLSMLVICQKK